MSPAVNDGEYILVKKPRSFRPGLIYVIEHSDLGRIVKRLKTIEGGQAVVFGDNPKSTPEAVIGPVAKERITGRAFLAITSRGLKIL
jgi:phage repressor protein C with HTH and peptisase S24 domain